MYHKNIAMAGLCVLMIVSSCLMGCSVRHTQKSSGELSSSFGEEPFVTPKQAPEEVSPEKALQREFAEEGNQNISSQENVHSSDETLLESDQKTIRAAAAPPPCLAVFREDGTVEVSDDVYRETAERTLETATSLKSGFPISNGIEGVFLYTSNYVVDIEGMRMNTKRWEKFLSNVAEKVPDGIVLIKVGPNETVPVMLETCSYSGDGSSYQAEQIFAFEGTIERRVLEREP